MFSKKILFLFLFFAIGQTLFAQNNPRFIALSLVNVDHRNPQIDMVNKAADLGMNALLLSIREDVIVNKKVSQTNPWKQYDDQIATARSRGMKICFRIVFSTWCNNKTVGEPLNNNVPTCSGYDATDRMLGYDFKGVARVHQQSAGYDGCDVIDDCGQFMTTSLSTPKTIIEMQDFTKQVLQRYKPIIDAGDVLYFSAVITPEQEFGFPFLTTKGLDGAVNSLFDYSQSMIKGYREYLKVKYNNDFAKLKTAWGSYADKYPNFDALEPPKPTSIFINWSVFLFGNAGTEWYNYRHSLLKNYSQNFIKTVKTFDARINVINDFGSLNDQPTIQRGTFAFKDLCEGNDGIKTNTSPTQDHQFMMDVMRTNFPNKWVMMESEANKDRVDLQEKQFIEAFTNGAKLVSAFAFDLLNNQSHRDMLQRMTTRFIKGNQQVQTVETCGTTVSSVYELLEDNGCAYNKINPEKDCRSYRDWAILRKANGDKPVRVLLDEGFVGKPFKLTQADLSICGSISNFKEIYSTDCQKVGTKPKANEGLKGMLESVNCSKVSGWALNTKNFDEIQTIDIYVDSVKIGTTQANIGNYPELVTTFNNPKANFRGFSFLLPDSAWYKSGQGKRIYARFANTSTLLEDNGDLKILACEGNGSGICGQKYRLIVSPDSLTNVLSKAFDYKISVSCNTKWQISKNVTWLTTSVDTGSYNGGFTLKITANADTGTRRGRVILTAGNLTKNITIAQKGVGQPYLVVSPDSITTISFVGAEYRVVVGSNVKIKISKNVPWIVTDPEVDVNNGSFGLRMEQNLDTATRKGKLILTGQGVTKVFYITQKGKGQACVGCNGSIDTDKPYTDPNEIAGSIAPPTYRGWVEAGNCCVVKGYAFNTQNYDDILDVDIYLDKLKIGSTTANLGYRTDLVYNFQSDKLLYKSFCFQVPKSTLDSFKNGKDKQLYVRFGGTVTRLFSPEQRYLNCKPNVICPEGFNCEDITYQDYIELVYPNPSKGKYNLQLYSIKKQIATLKLVDKMGILLKTSQYDVTNGLNVIEIDTEGINNGIILLSIVMENGNVLFKRLVKVSE
jgi:hypothetical protein